MFTEDQNQDPIEQTSSAETQVPETQEPVKVAPPDPEKMRRALADHDDDDFASIETPEIQIPTPTQEPKTPTPSTTQESVTQDPVTTTEVPKYNPLWDEIKQEYEEQLGEGSFKMPEFTPETERKALLDFLAQNLEQSSALPDDIPAELKEQFELHKQGKYDPHTYFQSKSPSEDVLNLPNKDFLRAMYKAKYGKSEANPEGYDDTEVEKFLEGKSKIELDEMAQAHKAQVKTSREQRQIQQQQAQQKKLEEQFEATRQQTLTIAKDVVNRHKQVNDYFGIELTSEEKAEYDSKVFPDMVALDKETKSSTLSKILQDDDLLYKLGAIVWKRDALKGYISDQKEKVKEETENKLDPKLDSGGGAVKLSKLLDASKLV